MKLYKTKPGEDLGSIALKFGLPSWKYLYQVNRSKIGDNPDLLKEGIELEIPQWDSTSGDEKIKAKGASPFQYTGGLRYAYPWVPFSLSLKDLKNNLLEKKERKVTIYGENSAVKLWEGTIQSADELEMLLPDSKISKISVDGLVLVNKRRSESASEAEETESEPASSD